MPRIHNPPPAFSPADAARIARERFGLEGAVLPLPGEHDLNFRIDAGGASYVLKIAHAGESRENLELQQAALAHLARRETGLALQRVVAAPDGATLVEEEAPAGAARAAEGKHWVRLLTFLPGRLWSEVNARRPPRAALLESLGATLGAIDRGFADFRLPADRPDLKWDLRLAGWIRDYLPHLADAPRRRLVERWLTDFDQRVRPALDRLRQSVIFNDANDNNIVVAGERFAPVVAGVIDFGDLCRTNVVCEPAIAAAYAAMGLADPVAGICRLLAGYHAAWPLAEAELEVLHALVCMRLCVSVTNSAYQATVEPGNSYLAISERRAWELLEALSAVEPRLALYSYRAACGFPAHPDSPRVVAWLRAHRERLAPLVAARSRHRPAALHRLERRQPGARFPGGARRSSGVDGATLRADACRRSLRRHRRLRRGPAGLREHGFPAARQRARRVADRPPRPRHLHARRNGRACASRRRRAQLREQRRAIRLRPLYRARASRRRRGRRAALSDALRPPERGVAHRSRGRAGGERRASVSRRWATFRSTATGRRTCTCRSCSTCSAERATSSARACPPSGRLWLELCPDPNLLARVPAQLFPAPPLSVESLLAERQELLGANLSLAYRQPLHLVRGFGQWLFDADGQRYLDAYNNVPQVGHSHPKVVRAVSEQLALLNTNTRYLHEKILRYARRLTAKLPEPLSVCYFTASGSEANELALRLARAHTGRRDMVVMAGAYHGHTTALIDLSPYKHAGPGGEGTPDWVHVSPVPDTYRGEFRAHPSDPSDPSGNSAPGARYAARVAEVIAAARARGRRIAGYLAETLPSVGGQIVLPEGFLPGVYAAVRAAGGLCIADEVQTGFGRTGETFWAFERYGVTPDIVVLGKPIANGYPMGAVVTTPEVARSFANGMEFFSTFGGSTAACAAALATLEVTEEEGLQANAAAVGRHLLRGLQSLAERHPLDRGRARRRPLSRCGAGARPRDARAGGSRGRRDRQPDARPRRAPGHRRAASQRPQDPPAALFHHRGRRSSSRPRWIPS